MELVVAVIELIGEEGQEGIREWIREEDGIDVEGMNEEQMIGWYGERVVVGEMEMSRMVQMFIRCCQIISTEYE